VRLLHSFQGSPAPSLAAPGGPHVRARRHGPSAALAGLVILQVLRGKDGGVREVTVLRTESLGMIESAVAALRQWRFEPALLNGRPVEALMTVTVTFALR